LLLVEPFLIYISSVQGLVWALQVTKFLSYDVCLATAVRLYKGMYPVHVPLGTENGVCYEGGCQKSEAKIGGVEREKE
jgi:hypothetical protein